ncbi:metabotropic glutamate receptor 7-like [Centruroides sculpturatus]|uniref:metabotropic glutamate receptor 7-like n=1 Tax=Centruroides sculpturatus TaxID=218467 RepID=UPI000C6E5B5F|nr:metabotropic glutamate receptor 7-like [Centruroides sculpturatus]
MRAIRRNNATGIFSWIGSDGWSARALVFEGNEDQVEGTLSVQPRANPVHGFDEYFLNLTVHNNRRNPWFVEYWEHFFNCRWPNSSDTPFNLRYEKLCTEEEFMTYQNGYEPEKQLQFVSDAVLAFAHALKMMHNDFCHGKLGLCANMKWNNGTILLDYLKKVSFVGLSGDEFRFSASGDGPARYNIIHFKQITPGNYKWIQVGEYKNGELELNLSEVRFRIDNPEMPLSVCSLPCKKGQAKKLLEGESCCWHCFNCSRYQFLRTDTQCMDCPPGFLPDDNQLACIQIPETHMKPGCPWAIGAMAFSAFGILLTGFVIAVFLKHNDTPIVRASGRELSYVLLSGIFMCYLMTFILVQKPTNFICGAQKTGIGLCFAIVYSAMLTKTNRISRIFDAGKRTVTKPAFISPQSQLVICGALIGVQISIIAVWLVFTPPRAIHSYPSREESQLVCAASMNATYMVAFVYPIFLIIVCTIYAILTRKIPEAFNESKYIGLTMYTTCIIWLAFVPIYFTTSSNVEVNITSMCLAISLSSTVTVVCLFTPKLYIIICHPEKNVRQNMMKQQKQKLCWNSSPIQAEASSQFDGVIIFGSDQEVAGVMRAIRRNNATGIFSWIGSDGWSARALVFEGNEDQVEGTLSVQPRANPVHGFDEYFLNLTVHNNRRNPWFVEYWEHFFNCRWPNSSDTPFNLRYEKLCTEEEFMTYQNGYEPEKQLQFVSDAVLAFAHALKMMHNDFCHGKLGLCANMKWNNGTILLDYLKKVSFVGLSGDEFRFSASGDGPARYNIIHFKQITPGNYKWIQVGEYKNGELELNLSEVRFRIDNPEMPLSVCSLPCKKGQAKKLLEGESCCWHCFNCSRYQFLRTDTQCMDCPPGFLPDDNQLACIQIPETHMKPGCPWAIGAMAFSAFGILLTGFVIAVFLKHNDTPIVRASGRELSYVLLSGIFMCYLMTFILVQKPTNFICGAQKTGIGLCFAIVYSAMLTKTNRISRIFDAGKRTVTKPAFISPQSQLVICGALIGVQISIIAVWLVFTPPRAIHSYPSREESQLVCAASMNATYMVAFVYPIFLIIVCTIYAILTRKIPEAFNESKYIGLTMYTTCIIWLAFVPIYFTTSSNVEVNITSMCLAISLSSTVTVVCLFTPKLYIIICHPEKNVRQNMMKQQKQKLCWNSSPIQAEASSQFDDKKSEEKTTPEIFIISEKNTCGTQTLHSDDNNCIHPTLKDNHM